MLVSTPPIAQRLRLWVGHDIDERGETERGSKPGTNPRHRHNPPHTVDFSDRQHSFPIFFFQDITSKTKGTRTYTCLCALHARTARSLRRSMASLADHQAKESPVIDLLQDSISISRLIMPLALATEQQRRLPIANGGNIETARNFSATWIWYTAHRTR